MQNFPARQVGEQYARLVNIANNVSFHAFCAAMCVCVSARQRNNLREAVVSLAKEGMFTICVVLFFDFRESWSWLPSSLNSEWSRNFDHFEFDRFELVVSILSSLSQEHARSRSTSHNFTAPCDQNRWHPRSRPPRSISQSATVSVKML